MFLYINLICKDSGFKGEESKFVFLPGRIKGGFFYFPGVVFSKIFPLFTVLKVLPDPRFSVKVSASEKWDSGFLCPKVHLEISSLSQQGWSMRVMQTYLSYSQTTFEFRRIRLKKKPQEKEQKNPPKTNQKWTTANLQYEEVVYKTKCTFL